MKEKKEVPLHQNSQITEAIFVSHRRVRTLIFILEITFIIVLLIWWLSSKSAHKSTNLWVLFFCCFPSEFLVSAFPHEPILLYFGKFYSSLIVASISIIGTVLTETLNYSVFNYVMDIGPIRKVRENKVAKKVIRLFEKAPFAALLIAAFTPIPFYPFRFLVVLAHYPLAKYLLAIFLARFPRFVIIALAGKVIRVPDWMLAVLMAVLIIVANFPILKRLLGKKFKKQAE